MAKPPQFSMPFEASTIKHLGLRLYNTLPPVISELVSNAYDADAKLVEVTIPESQIDQLSEVRVRDYGHGLNAEELQNEYLPIGRDRRGVGAQVCRSKSGMRHVTGRKGLGKLAAFGVAEEIEFRAIKARQAICLRLRFKDMLDWARHHGANEPYQPEVVKSKSGRTSDHEGVEVTLRNLKRRRSIVTGDLRSALAQRLHVIGAGFDVRVNDVSISSSDRVSRNDCNSKQHWDVQSIPDIGNSISKDHSVTGWVGFLPTSSQIGRGINIVAHGKSVELGSFFNLSSTHAQFARAYLVGEVQADFLDDEEDLVSTARNSVVWESDVGQYLEAWGQRVIHWALNQWTKERHDRKASEIYTVAGLGTWIATRPKTEQGIARRMVDLLIRDDAIDPESAVPLVGIIKSSVENVYFHELVEALENGATDPKGLLNLFEDWRIIEARTHLNMADGRRQAVNQLSKYIDEGAYEVSEMQPLLEKNLWLLDPKWTEAEGQSTYTKLLRQTFGDTDAIPEIDRRLDILAVTGSGALTVVEIKHPKKTVSREDCNQIEHYVQWMQGNLGSKYEHGIQTVRGLLIVGRLSPISDVSKKMEQLEREGIRVLTYRDLYNGAQQYFNVQHKHLEKVAPEYEAVRPKRKKKKVSASKQRTRGTRKKSTTKKSKAPSASAKRKPR
jgi:hypothetical protein